MKVILKQDVLNLGYKDDIVDVCFAKKLENERPVINSVCRFVLKDDENVLYFVKGEHTCLCYKRSS